MQGTDPWINKVFEFFVGSFTEDHPVSSLAVVFGKSKESEIWSILSAISQTATAQYLTRAIAYGKVQRTKKVSLKSFAIDKAHGSSRSLLFVTRMRSNSRYKLGRISFLFFFIMVVANCDESCYWLHVHCSQSQLLLFLPSGIKIAFVAIWRVSCGEFGYCLTRCTNPELVAKCEHILCVTSCDLNERAAKPKCVAQS